MVGPVTFRPQAIPVERKTPPDGASRPVSQQVSAGQKLSPQLSTSRLADLARDLAEAGPPVDHARIARLRQAIAQGSYEVDAGRIADALLRQLTV
ncbi:flagellar biosynthesis anti-sigma factor FlgM [Sphingorhabdus pulchriflava]|uniref:Negative regulator of flagellin synthesis n=1 Tax=Sphingorhabdus pulchriflava TaxID=2292257 RepID=A0A371B548_9SPHN|nr:flagellar biosynthesis anti-sigma factor FlgM [Sphingorhabdus pulchriflava]RDV02674.1 flagellar biosynthesis anti-sigma factor FlgM [Sphingorhabdus pulchriflava]